MVPNMRIVEEYDEHYSYVLPYVGKSALRTNRVPYNRMHGVRMGPGLRPWDPHTKSIGNLGTFMSSTGPQVSCGYWCAVCVEGLVNKTAFQYCLKAAPRDRVMSN